MELLQDSSAWIIAPDLEDFLESVLRMSWKLPADQILKEAGHAGPKTRAWGVLDSVLRMMPRPQEIFQQPQTFLSYFIAPAPPVENIERNETEISLDLPLPAEQYPLVTSYLKAAFESLPLYVGQGLATCTWTGIRLRICWPEQQETMFEIGEGHQINPELLRQMVANQQSIQRELEDKNRDLKLKDEEISMLRQDLEQFQKYGARVVANTVNDWNDSQVGYGISQNLARLHDYMVRAQQLITLLTAFSKSEPSVRGILKRLDWEQVKQLYPRAISESFEELRSIRAKKLIEQKPKGESSCPPFNPSMPEKF